MEATLEKYASSALPEDKSTMRAIRVFLQFIPCSLITLMNPTMVLKIGTRGSKLALAQSEWVKGRIEQQYPDLRVTLVRIKTRGDKILDSPLSRIGGKGLFVREIEDALLRKQVDLAVHSMKDVPSKLPRELTLSSYPEREDPRDALISMGNQNIDGLPEGARVGTSSLRRKAQLLS